LEKAYFARSPLHVARTAGHHRLQGEPRGSPGGVTNTDPSLPDELNLFYARLQGEPTTKMANHPEDYVLQLTESKVCKIFRRVKAGKAAGPDGVPPCVFKTCADQLAPVFMNIFNASLQQAVVTVRFKETTIVLLLKKTKVTGLNDYRPVALTLIAMKCLITYRPDKQ